jgi:hypothetical protein
MLVRKPPASGEYRVEYRPPFVAVSCDVIDKPQVIAR